MDFKLRGNRLHMAVFFRAWDIGKKFVPDAVNLALIQRRVAEELGAEAAALTLFAASAHLYLEDAEIIRKANQMAGGLSS
jgi:thymidylate synthase